MAGGVGAVGETGIGKGHMAREEARGWGTDSLFDNSYYHPGQELESMSTT